MAHSSNLSVNKLVGNTNKRPAQRILTSTPQCANTPMDCLSAPAPMKKHRNRLRAGRAFYMLFSLLHFAIGIFMAVEKCPFGWHVIGFTLVPSPEPESIFEAGGLNLTSFPFFPISVRRTSPSGAFPCEQPNHSHGLPTPTLRQCKWA